jgi:uncharacterized membrane protein
MGLDIKIPIGLMFSILGLLLTIYGLSTISNIDMYQKSFSINVNLWSGLFMLAFGAFMLLTSRLVRRPKKNK